MPVPSTPVPTRNDIERARAKALASLEPLRLTLKKSDTAGEILQALQAVINNTEYLTCLQADLISATKENRKRR